MKEGRAEWKERERERGGREKRDEREEWSGANVSRKGGGMCISCSLFVYDVVLVCGR